MNFKKTFSLFLLLVGVMFLAGCTFIESGSISSYDLPGFFSGFWHGLIAPYTLIVRWFTDVYMYAAPNSGWFYDFGFLLGVGFSLPIGWLAAIVSTVLLILG
ncbi:hypothetical protein KKF38_01395 [Patescibacteria group bacterium]|nr:hypothetical protein [Patescibacteria group bacterium]